MEKHNFVADLKECKTEKELLKVVEYITQNSKKLRLDEVDLAKLEDIGMRRYEEIQRDRNNLIRNKKQGFNKFGDE